MLETNNENKFIGSLWRVLPALASGIAIIIGIYAWVEKPIQELKMQNALLEQKISTIQENELVHIKEDLVELKGRMTTNDMQHLDMIKSLERILTILEK